MSYYVAGSRDHGKRADCPHRHRTPRAAQHCINRMERTIKADYGSSASCGRVVIEVHGKDRHVWQLPTDPDADLNQLYITKLTPVLRHLEDRATAQFVEAVMERARCCGQWICDAAGVQITFRATQAQIGALLGQSGMNVGRKLRTYPAIQRYVSSLRDGHKGKGSVFTLSFSPEVCRQAGIQVPSPAKPKGSNDGAIAFMAALQHLRPLPWSGEPTGASEPQRPSARR